MTAAVYDFKAIKDAMRGDDWWEPRDNPAPKLETVRKVLERAKGLLQEKMKISEPEAFRWIQKASMDRRLTMAEVAQAVIDQLL